MDTVRQLIDEQISQLRAKGLSSRKISMQLSLQEKFVRKRISVLGLPNLKKGGDFHSEKTNKRRLLFLQQAEQGKTVKEIAIEHKVSLVTVRKGLAALGVKASAPCRQKTSLGDRENNLLWNEYDGNPSIINRNKLVVANLKLVYYCAHKFSKTLEFEDLVQAGVLGLIQAIERFDPAKGNKFSSYAVILIRGSILHYLRDCHNLIKCRANIIPVLSLDIKISAEHENGTMFLDTIPTKEECKWEGMDVQAAIETLEPEYREVIELHFFQGVEQQRIAVEFGVSLATVRNRIKSALFYLKHELN